MGKMVEAQVVLYCKSHPHLAKLWAKQRHSEGQGGGMMRGGRSLSSLSLGASLGGSVFAALMASLTASKLFALLRILVLLSWVCWAMGSMREERFEVPVHSALVRE